MSKYLDHNENIASYLDGQMSPDQMQEFEKQLHTDPVLRSEFELQQDIIHTLKDFRKTQLKTRLDQVPVSMGPTGLMGIKAAAAIVITGIIGVGAYLYFATPVELPQSITEASEPLEQVQQEVITEVPVELDETPQQLHEEEISEPETVVEKPVVDKAVSKPEIKTTTKSENETQEEEVEQLKPVINSPNLINPHFEETESEESFEIPTSSLAQEGLADNNVVEIETAKRDREMFHYQYYSGKLYLYGDFRENPYEILELNSSTGKRLFIYYNDSYYRILDGQQEITPLEKLASPDIIKKLEIIQANK